MTDERYFTVPLIPLGNHFVDPLSVRVIRYDGRVGIPSQPSYTAFVDTNDETVEISLTREDIEKAFPG